MVFKDQNWIRNGKEESQEKKTGSGSERNRSQAI